jgi:hypothetical protein
LLVNEWGDYHHYNKRKKEGKDGVHECLVLKESPEISKLLGTSNFERFFRVYI